MHLVRRPVQEEGVGAWVGVLLHLRYVCGGGVGGGGMLGMRGVYLRVCVCVCVSVCVGRGGGTA